MQLKNNLAGREDAILFGARGFESQATCSVYGRHRQNDAISDYCRQGVNWLSKISGGATLGVKYRIWWQQSALNKISLLFLSYVLRLQKLPG